MGTFTNFLLGRSADTPPPLPPQGSGVMPPSRSEVSVTADTALTLSAVYRAISILATAASQLTLDAWRSGEPIERPAVLRKPDVNTHLSAFLEGTVTSLATSGNAYWRLTRNARGEVTNVTLLDPWQAFPNEDGTLGFGGKTLKPDEFRHLALLRLPGRTLGLGPIQACREEIRRAMQLGTYSGAIFNTGSIPSGVLKTDQNLSPDQAKQFQDSWEARDPRSVAVLGHGLDYRPVLLDPESAQFLESQQFSTTAIARLFGIPAHMLLAAVEGSSLTYTNVAQADLAFVRWTLSQYTREIEEAFTSILPGTQTARFNLDAILRPDTRSRYEAHEIALRAGFLTVEEVREIEGLN